MLNVSLRLLALVAMVGGLVVAPSSVAVADACQPVSGEDQPPIAEIPTDGEDPAWYREVETRRLDPIEPDAHDVVLSGGGWGHGVGMSQYGAQGAALMGCTHEDILTTYFPGTGIETLAEPRDELRLKLWTTDASGTTGVWVQEAVDWVACDVRDDQCAVVHTQAADSSLTVSLDDGQFRLAGSGVDTRFGSAVYTVLRLEHDGRLMRVQQGAPASGSTGLPVRYGTLEFDFTTQFGGRLFATQVIGSGGSSGRTAMETYLLGLAEVPFAWHAEALRAQVIAARSFAEATVRARDTAYTNDTDDNLRIQALDCRCDLRVTTGDQVWAGANKELAEPTYYPAWQEAVDDTHDRHLVGEGQVVTAFYSSSHGGWSADGFATGFTGSDRPWYRGVDASHWERRVALDPEAPPDQPRSHARFRWSQGFGVAELQSALGIDDIDAIEVEATDAGGYPLTKSVLVTGVDDGEPVTRGFSGNELRSLLGLLSPRFTVHTVTDLAADDAVPVTRLAGDTRIGTALRLAQAGWRTSPTVVLARADDPADSLTGSALAGTLDAPLLLTPSDALPEEVATGITRLAPEEVLVLGGPAAISDQVVEDLHTLGIQTITRVQGEDRFATAADVATRVARGEETTAYLVRLRDSEIPARGWVDALSVSAVAARRGGASAGWPILGTDAELPDATRQAVTDLGITRVVPIGGPDTIPDTVLETLAADGVEVADRLAGADRYGTSRAVTATDTPPDERLVIATALNYPDGLAAGPYAARTGSALLMVPTELDVEAPPWLAEEHPATVAALGWLAPSLVAVGGPVAVTNEVIAHVADLLEAARG